MSGATALRRGERVAVLGAGTIGAGWTALFLAGGLEVQVFDPAPGTEGRVRRFVERAWPALERLGLTRDGDPGRFELRNDPANAVAGAVFVQESGPEDLAAKRALVEAIEPALATDAIVASSTSGIMPSDLQAGRSGPGRYLVGHPFNPPHLIPLVEVVPGQLTDPAVVERAMAVYAGLGKRPIRVEKELPGHVANRMQAALLREAIHLALEGVASLEDIDAAIWSGPGLRWALMGPHLQHHLAGGEGGYRHLLDHIGPGIEAWWNSLGRPALTPDVKDRLVALLEASDPPPIPDLVAERDRLLTALLELLGPTGAGLGRKPGA